MPYSTVTDISNVIGEQAVQQLTDDNGLGSVDQVKVDAAIAAADEIIDGYLRARYTLPLSAMPPLIRDLSAGLAIYKLYERRFAASMPDSISKKYDNTIKLLSSIQKGTISLGIEASAEPASGGFKTNKTADDRIFPKVKLDQW